MKSRGLGDVYKRQVQWEGNGEPKVAGIKAAYVDDPGQNLNIEVKGLEGYSKPVKVSVTTRRPEERETFSLKNGESAVKTILTFDANGYTQGPNNVTISADPAPNTNYQGPTINTSAYPIIRVVYERKALNLTVRKVYNLSLIHISEPTRLHKVSRMPSSA